MIEIDEPPDRNYPVYILYAPSAATHRFRALRHELHDGPAHELPDAGAAALLPPLGDPDKTLAEFSGVARKGPMPTGDFCTCGGMLVQTGTCKTCNSCGVSSGGCG